jgi:protein-S-isoprenylcysteine O-methyltransferase Ste14
MDAGGGEAKSERRAQSSPPQLVAWLASLATIALIWATLLLPQGGNSHLRVAGAVVLMLGGVFAYGPFLLLRRHGQAEDGETYMETGAVAEQGLYSVTRHPQYLGYMLMTCGFALLSQHWVSLLLAVLGVSLFYCQAVNEEKYSLIQLGEPYERYLRRVPRFNVILGIVRLLRGSRGIRP